LSRIGLDEFGSLPMGQSCRHLPKVAMRFEAGRA
jgi:hypothetical protein